MDERIACDETGPPLRHDIAGTGTWKHKTAAPKRGEGDRLRVEETIQPADRAGWFLADGHAGVLESRVICPRCGHYSGLRSHRRTIEYPLGILGILPWRCVDCRKRFYARRVPFRFALYAHCNRCGNLDLQPARREKLARALASRLAMGLGARPVRCDGCRNDFTTWRPLRRARMGEEDVERAEVVSGKSRRAEASRPEPDHS